MKSSKLLFVLSFVVIGVVFYAWDCHNMFICDDVFYAFKFDTNQRIESLSDILDSQVDHYLYRNGRFIVHCIVQLFCGILGPQLFYLINTFIYLLFLFTVYYYVKKYINSYSYSIFAFLFFATIIFIPRWSITTIGNVSCSVNYLWCSTFYLLFIIFYTQEKEKQRSVCTFYSIVFFLLSLIVGSLQESFCIGISGYFLFYYFKYPKLFKGSVIPIVLGFLVGSVIIVVAPGNYIRFEEVSAQTPITEKFFSNILSFLFGGYGLPLLLLLCLVAWFRKRDVLYSVLKQHDIFLFSIIFNGLFVSLFAYTGDHQLTSIGVFSMILFLILFYNLIGDAIQLYEIKFTFVIALLWIFIFVIVFQERKKISLAYDEMWENARITKNGIVVDEKYDSLSSLKKNWLQSNFTRYTPIGFYERKWMSLYLTDGKDEHHCRVVLPDKPDVVVKYCVPKFQVSQNVYKPIHKNYYILVTYGEPSSTKRFHVVSETFPKMVIINMIKTGSPNAIQDKSLSSLLDYFTIGNSTYYIYRDSQDMKALSVELRPSES